MLTKMLKNDELIVRRYIEIIYKSKSTLKLIKVDYTKGALMPADVSEFSDKASESVHFDPETFRLTDYRKVYTKFQLNPLDIVIEEATNIHFKVFRLYDYSRWDKLARHYKSILVKEED